LLKMGLRHAVAVAGAKYLDDGMANGRFWQR
jgi:hypothetical protein